MSNFHGEIVLRNQHRQIVVVHEPRHKQLAVYSSSPTGSSLHLARPTAACPTCGQPIQAPPGSAVRGAGPSFGPEPPANASTSDRPLGGDPGSANTAAPSVHSAAELVGTNYFQLLDKYFREEAGVRGARDAEFALPGTEAPTCLPNSVFNDGYFARFFVRERSLGRGAKAEVSLVHHILDGISIGSYALKLVAVGDSHPWLEKVLREVRLMSLRHANIVNYNHVWLEHAKLTQFGPQVPALYILQEYCNGGTLDQFVRARSAPAPTEYASAEERKQRTRRSRSHGSGAGNRPEAQRAAQDLPPMLVFALFRDLVSGIEFLQSKGVVHRDLKPSNCLLHYEEGVSRPRALVGDFGEGQILEEMTEASRLSISLPFTAPELIRKEGGNIPSFKSDIFSLGMILYYLVYRGRLPWSVDEADDYDGLADEIRRWSGFEHDAAAATEIPEAISMLLENMLKPEPQERWDIQQISRYLDSMEPLVSEAVATDDARPLAAARERVASVSQWREKPHTERNDTVVLHNDGQIIVYPKRSIQMTSSRIHANIIPIAAIIRLVLAGTAGSTRPFLAWTMLIACSVVDAICDSTRVSLLSTGVYAVTMLVLGVTA